MREAGISDKAKCHFVDDSALNIHAATDFGWKTNVFVCEPGHVSTHTEDIADIKYVVEDVKQLEGILPQFFKS